MLSRKIVRLVFIALLVCISACDNKNESYKKTTDSLQDEIAQLKSPTNIFSISSQDTFAKVDNFYVSLTSVRKYVDGYILVFEVGNPLFVTYRNIKIQLTCGKLRPKQMTYDEWEKNLLSKTQIIKKEILPGMWNKVEIIVSPAKEEDLSLIHMKINSDAGTLVLKKDHREDVQ